MGILSEMDMMNRDAEDDAFEVSSDSETVDSFSEEFEPVETQKQEPQAEDAEEARKKAEFDAAEAKRKAEWEAKQAQKKLREQQELDRLAAMSDDDVMQASMNRVSQDTDRLTRRNMKLCVMEYVQTECLADPGGHFCAQPHIQRITPSRIRRLFTASAPAPPCWQTSTLGTVLPGAGSTVVRMA